MPAASDAVLKVVVATPARVESVPLPSEVPPSSKVTVPVGVKEPVGNTVAVRVMLCPLTDGLLLEVSGVGSLTDYANVQRILESVPGVRGANIARAGGNSATFDITARGGSDALDKALAGSSHLARSDASNARLVYQYHP